MALMDYILGRRKKSASVAKERLQIILAREHKGSNSPDYLPALKKDILAVVGKYIAIDHSMVQVSLDSNDDCDILELNITLPENQTEIKEAEVV